MRTRCDRSPPSATVALQFSRGSAAGLRVMFATRARSLSKAAELRSSPHPYGEEERMYRAKPSKQGKASAREASSFVRQLAHVVQVLICGPCKDNACDTVCFNVRARQRRLSPALPDWRARRASSTERARRRKRDLSLGRLPSAAAREFLYVSAMRPRWLDNSEIGGRGARRAAKDQGRRGERTVWGESGAPLQFANKVPSSLAPPARVQAECD